MASRQHIQVLFFLLSFFLAQGIVISAEYKHPLHEPDSSCDICLVADHFSNGLITPESGDHLHLSSALNNNASVLSFFEPLLTAYSVRAPPTP